MAVIGCNLTVDKALPHDPPSLAGVPKPPPPRTLRSKPPQKPAPGLYRLSPISWIIFLILMIWNVWSFSPKQTLQLALPYSAFVGQVAGGNVSQVRIVGDDITGTLVQAIVWPEPAKAAAESKKAGEESKAGEEQKPSTYSTFRTVFPSVVGDASLMPLRGTTS